MLTVKQVARRLQLSPTKIRDLICEHRFPNARKKDPLKQTSPYLIPEIDVLEFEHQFDPVPNPHLPLL